MTSHRDSITAARATAIESLRASGCTPVELVGRLERAGVNTTRARAVVWEMITSGEVRFAGSSIHLAQTDSAA